MVNSVRAIYRECDNSLYHNLHAPLCYPLDSALSKHARFYNLKVHIIVRWAESTGKTKAKEIYLNEDILDVAGKTARKHWEENLFKVSDQAYTI